MRSQYREGERRKARGAVEKERKGWGAAVVNALRLAVCGLILLVSVITKTFFPAAMEAAGTRIRPLMEEDIDYRGTVTAIGEMLTGKSNIQSVIGDIYIKAFGGGDSGAADPAETATEPADTPGEGTR